MGLTAILDILARFGTPIFAFLVGAFLFIVGRKNGKLEQKDISNQALLEQHKRQIDYERMSLQRLEDAKAKSDQHKDILVKKLVDLDPLALSDPELNRLYQNPADFLDDIPTDPGIVGKTPPKRLRE